MRRLLVGAGLTLAVCVAPAWAATTGVDVSDFAFKPPSVEIQPGDTVTWTFSGSGGFDLRHSVTSTSGQSESFDSDPGNPSPLHSQGDTFSHTFATPGRFTYFCKVHSNMQGTVVVAGEPPPPGPDTTAPGVSGLVAKGGRKCGKRAPRKCKARSTRIAFGLSEDASVRISFTRRGGGKAPRAVEREMAAGDRSVRLSTKAAPPGRYTLSLVATDAAGNASEPATAKFRVR